MWPLIIMNINVVYSRTHEASNAGTFFLNNQLDKWTELLQSHTLVLRLYVNGIRILPQNI